MTWTAVYSGYDDQALTALANPGLVRRATKLAASAVLDQRDDDSGTVTVGDHPVRLDRRGPAHGRCPCPTAGVCVHVLAAAMVVRALVPDDPDGAPDVGSPDQQTARSDAATASSDASTSSPDQDDRTAVAADRPASLAGADPTPVIDEIVALKPATVCRRAGIAAGRQAYQRLTDSPVTLTGSPRWVDIAWDDRSVRYVAGAGWDGMVSHTKADERHAVHLEALARVFGQRGVPWAWPPAVVAAAAEQAVPDGPTPATRALTASVRDEIAATVGAGLSHLSPDAAERLADLAFEARVSGLPLLASHLGTGAALVEKLAEHRDDVSETEATSALARVWALARALDTSADGVPARPTISRPAEDGLADDRSHPPTAGDSPEAAVGRWARLRGTARRTFETSSDAMTLHPLGATWWVTPTGARGITLTAWDADAATVRTATTARPVGTDPRFVRSPDTTALWGTAMSRLLAGPFQVDSPRVAADGSLSPTARSVTCLPGDLDETVLHQVSTALAPSLATGAPGVGFAGVDQPVALVTVRGFGRLVVDEPTQQLVWSLPVADRDDDLVLHLQIDGDTVHRVDSLLALEASSEFRAQVVHVLARQTKVRSGTVWEPTTVVLRRAGRLELFSLDFTSPPSPSFRSLLQRRWDMLSRRWAATPPTPTVVRPAVAVVCDDVRDLVVALTATGRLALSPRQRQRCDDLARRCDDLALATLASCLRHLGEHPDVETLLRANHVADRVAALTAAG